MHKDDEEIEHLIDEDTRPEQIARDLTKAERNALRWLHPSPDYARQMRRVGDLQRPFHHLRDKHGLVEKHRDGWWSITPLGAQVRAALNG